MFLFVTGSQFFAFIFSFSAGTFPDDNLGYDPPPLPPQFFVLNCMFSLRFFAFLCVSLRFFAILFTCNFKSSYLTVTASLWPNESIGCGTCFLLWNLGAWEVVGSWPGRGNSRKSLSSCQETGKVFCSEMPLKAISNSKFRSSHGEV